MVTDGIATQLASQMATGGASPGAANVRAESFNLAFADAQARQAETTHRNGLTSVLSPLLSLGEQSSKLAAEAGPMLSNEFRPSELMMITMRSHQFLFHCELVANVANRASDGVQQLFRQQS